MPHHAAEKEIVLILQFLLHLLHLMFLLGEKERESEANRSADVVWFYWRQRHACQPFPDLIFSLILIHGRSG